MRDRQRNREGRQRLWEGDTQKETEAMREVQGSGEKLREKLKNHQSGELETGEPRPPVPPFGRGHDRLRPMAWP